jgi:hypothetical protein
MLEFGYGANPEFVQWMGDRYIDLAQELTREDDAAKVGGSYSDFEGFADADKVIEIVTRAIVARTYADSPGNPTELVRTLTYHYVFECCNQAEAPSHEDVVAFIDQMMWLFTCRFYMKIDA